MALTYDAVQLFAETSKHLSLQPVSLNCSNTVEGAREDGSTFKNYMRSVRYNNSVFLGMHNFDLAISTWYILFSLVRYLNTPISESS